MRRRVNGILILSGVLAAVAAAAEVLRAGLRPGGPVDFATFERWVSFGRLYETVFAVGALLAIFCAVCAVFAHVPGFKSRP